MSKDEQRSDQGQPKRKPATRSNYEGLIEQRIQQAQEDGLFDNLPGAGKPLKFDDESLVPVEDRAGHRLLKNSGFTLPWIAARQDIDEQRAQLDTWLTQSNHRWLRLDAAGRAVLKVAYRRKLDDLQRLILNFNLKVPRGIDQVETLRMVDELQKLGRSETRDTRHET